MRRLTNLETYLSLDPSELADTVLTCPVCNREHKLPFNLVKAGTGLVSELPGMIQSLLGRRPEKVGVVYDRQIEEKLDALFFAPFRQTGVPFVRFPLGEKGTLLVASVVLGDEGAASLPAGVDFLIGVGSGVISDLTKWIATQRKLPFLLFGTAASMNAYTSITGSMTEHNIKTSKWLTPANAVVLDAGVLASAPGEMTGAGVGDLLARNVANADWKLSESLRQTYFCPVPYQMMTSYQERFLPLAGALGQNEVGAMGVLAEAVLVSGYSMTVLDGETSPSSGAEHILSHFFDFQHDVFGLPKHLHGAQVGLGTIVISTAYEILREMSPDDFDLDALAGRRASLDTIRQAHQREFGEHGRIFDEVTVRKRIPDADYRGYLERLLGNWESLWAAVNPYRMSSRELRQAIQAAGGVTRLADLDRTPVDAIQALLYGAHYRPRYTILDLYEELGLFPELAPLILERSGVLV